MKRILTLIFVLAFLTQVVSQQTIVLDSVEWRIDIPEGYSMTTQDELNESQMPVLLFLSKKGEEQINTLKAEFFESNNLEKLTPAIYALTLKDDFEKRFNNDDFRAEVRMEPVRISNQSFYRISTFITDKASDDTYIYDYWMAEMAGKELGITVFSDNDDDKEKLINAILNSEFL